MPNAGFVHLHVHSQYSLLDAVCHIEDLAETAKEFGMSALAITDNGNMFGVIEFYNDAARPNPGLDPETHPLHLAAEEKRALLALLSTLSGRIRDGSR